MNELFKALSDPTRRAILELLYEKDLTAGEIALNFSISKPSISHHLTILKNAGLIQDKRSGQNIIYSINMTVFDECVNWFFKIKEKRNEQKD